MPNTPASIGCGMTALTADNGADTIHVEALFNAVGEVAVVSEADLDRLGALSGAGPGYMFVILDALADAGSALDYLVNWRLRRLPKRCMGLVKWH